MRTARWLLMAAAGLTLTVCATAQLNLAWQRTYSWNHTEVDGAQAGPRPAPAVQARIDRDVRAIHDACNNWSGPHGLAPRPHKEIDKAVPRSEAVWLLRAARGYPWWRHVGRAVSFIGAFYGIDRARYTNHLASICLYFGSHRSPKDLRNPALRWEPRGYDWALPAMSAEGYLINLYWWQRDRAALAAAFRYWWSGGPSEGRLNDIYDAWRYARSDMLRCAATDYGVARVLADGFYSGGPNNEEAVLPAPTRTLRILRRMGRRHTVVGRGARAVAAALAHELHVYGPPTW